MMKARIVALFFFAAPFCAVAEEPVQPIDLNLSSVTAVTITGEASSIALTTTEDEPYQATLGGVRSGWFAKWYSSWFYTDCRTSSRMRIENTTLHVDAGSVSWLEPSDCKVEFKANVRKGTSISIEQAASQVSLAGDFSMVSLDNKAADVTLNGYAESIELRGDAIRSHLTYRQTRNSETIEITGRALDTYLGFVSGTQISYKVDAVAAMVDSSLPNTTDAKPSVTIKGQYVRATIR
ncbi:UNVERIFIED_ORG: hypothetical protein LHK14_19165 [Roseateles sp. XES5]|nr:hypothetical protein [Roseateles sp. XES5]